MQTVALQKVLHWMCQNTFACLVLMTLIKYQDTKQEAQRTTYRAPEYNVPLCDRMARAPFFLLIGLKNTNLVEDLEILLPVKFYCIPFSSFRGEVENVSANQRPGLLSWFSDRPENINLIEDIEIFLPVKFHWIPFSGFKGEVENVSANQRPGQPSCFSDRPENTQTW